ncbi:TFIIB-type zinc ribbon-containing protein [Haladaptatus sp. NG-WS-4]
MATRDIYENGFDEDVPSETTDLCPECDGQVNTNTRETTCDDCGLVVDEHDIDHGPEWRYDDGETNRKRTGGSRTPTYHDYGLTTALYGQTDSNGNTLSESVLPNRCEN